MKTTVLLLSLILTAALFVTVAASSPPGSGSQGDRLQKLGEQVKRMKSEFPELYSFMEDREVVLRDAILQMAAHVPDPEKLPTFKFPDIGVEEVIAAESHEKCKHLLDQNPYPWLNLTDRERELFRKINSRHYGICLNGVRQRKTSFKGLLGE